ncbi:streptophobe family protein [Wenjunlia tyrosinilytica]|nr:streptophobe family protein [Wenjunlia tyrosinilytica]
MTHLAIEHRENDKIGALYDWLHALAVVVAGLIAMAVVAALGMWLAGASNFSEGAFLHVLAAAVVMAVGGSMRLQGNAGFIARTDAGIAVVPLSVSLAGALVIAVAFLLPLRHRAVAGTGELLGRVARTVILWLGALALLAMAARHTFTVSLEDSTVSDIGEAFGATPTVGFHADYGPTLGFGLLWLLVVLTVALAASRRAPLPSRLLSYQESVRPVAFATVMVLLAYVAVGAVVGVVVALTQGHTRDTFAVIFLGLPNLVWLAFGLGLDATWDGHVNGGIGLPMPEVLAAVLRTPARENVTLGLSSLSHYDGRVWLLPVASAVMLLLAGFVAAVRSPVTMPPWRHAVHLGLGVAAAVLVIGLVTRISAHYGLSLLGVDSGRLSDIADLLGAGGGGGGAAEGAVVLRPNLAVGVPLGALWGLIAGFLGSLLATPVRRRGEVVDAEPPRATV